MRFTSERVRMMWRERPSLLQRIALVVIGLVLIGLFVIVGTLAMVVGGAFVLAMAIIVLVQRGLAKLRGERGPGDTMRKNVRVMPRDGET